MQTTKAAKKLSGKRILIVEDEYYLADDLAQFLRENGADIAGPAGTLEQAYSAMGEGKIDCAILDINLRGEMVFPLADRLDASGVPFVIVSGYDLESLPDRFVDTPRFEKPFETSRLVSLIPDL